MHWVPFSKLPPGIGSTARPPHATTRLVVRAWPAVSAVVCAVPLFVATLSRSGLDWANAADRALLGTLTVAQASVYFLWLWRWAIRPPSVVGMSDTTMDIWFPQCGQVLPVLIGEGRRVARERWMGLETWYVELRDREDGAALAVLGSRPQW